MLPQLSKGQFSVINIDDLPRPFQNGIQPALFADDTSIIKSGKWECNEQNDVEFVTGSNETNCLSTPHNVKLSHTVATTKKR